MKLGFLSIVNLEFLNILLNNNRTANKNLAL